MGESLRGDSPTRPLPIGKSVPLLFFRSLLRFLRLVSQGGIAPALMWDQAPARLAVMSGGAKKGRPKVRQTSGDRWRDAKPKKKRRHQGLIRRNDPEWTAVCTCGWKVVRPSEALAHEALEDHLRRGERRRKQRPKNSKRSESDRSAHELVLLEVPNGRWTAKCKCDWQNEEPTLSEAKDDLQDHLHENGGVWLDQPLFPWGTSDDEAKRNIRRDQENKSMLAEREERDADMLEEMELPERHMPPPSPDGTS